MYVYRFIYIYHSELSKYIYILKIINNKKQTWMKNSNLLELNIYICIWIFFTNNYY